MAKPLTVRTLETIRPGEARKEVPDGLVRGLYYILQPSGKAGWAVRYRVSGVSRKMTLGTYPALSLKAARDLAAKALVKVAGGEDPAAAKQFAKAAKQSPLDHDLVEKVAEQFIARHIKASMRPSWAREAERMMRKEVIASWRGRKLSEIRKADIHELLDSIVDRPAPIVANRVLAIFRRMCGWAVERGIIEASPCLGIRSPSPERSRDRVLDDVELRAVWLAAEGLGWPFGRIIQLLILTGQRLGEVSEMRWSELDFTTRTWTLPKERCKNGQAHQVPLSPQALAILEGLPRIGGASDFVFTTNGRTPVSGFSKARAHLGAALPAAPHWTFHDLRRTAATGMARLGVSIPVIEKILNHRSGSFAGIVGIYQRHGFADEKRVALETWGRFVETLVNGEPAGNVAALTTARG
ncbi:tyrosine-type recombinase/integrase [Methylocapsa palsarum]|uniref:Integrase n=1 Tax=Methylocapsa palsarum TaxID=1612308 RepID=A0A1I3Y9E4_9HYPH|nr:site-specific integrase [Methylocapsa palsarum]SFK28597.1 Integrase [Methylocapsa palsarum]